MRRLTACCTKRRIRSSSGVQGHGTGGVYAEPADPEYQPPGGCQGDTAASQPTAAPCAQPGGAAAALKATRQYRGTVVARRATLFLPAVLEDGQTVEIKYHAQLTSALVSLFKVNLHEVPECLSVPLTPKNLPEALERAAAPYSLICYYKRGAVRRVQMQAADPLLSFPLRFLVKRGRVYLIKDIAVSNKCDFCGSFYKVTHTCSARRRDFYFHHISTHSADWWETISFTPIGSPPTDRLFIVYDVETYTWHGRFGKQLVPFMLVFQVFGTEDLADLARQVAFQEGWDRWQDREDTFFCLNPQKKTVGMRFKRFRDILQSKVVAALWSHVLSQNPQLEEFATQAKLPYSEEMTPEQLKELKLQGLPRFIEVYIVGHNITGFDEILLAAQVINNRAAIPPAFRVTRNFMPRAGRLLFNDVTYSLPNPVYRQRKDFAEWEAGCLLPEDCKWQYVKFMVRDTFALTHTSLRNAAKAYGLETSKGHCPYQAVNEFYMLGSYQQDEDGFPAQKYWGDPEEYRANKALWLQEKRDAYDIVRHTLDYCAQDVIVTAQLVRKLAESYRAFVAESVNLPAASFNVFQRPTISSNSHAIFKQVLFRAERPDKNNLGEALLAPSHEMYEYVRASIRGGRCYPTYIGVLSEPVYVYDICGMYASALTHPFPAGYPLNPYDRAVAVSVYERKMKAGGPLGYFDPDLLPAVFTIDADPPDDEMLDVLPPFCSRKGGRLCWTNEPLRGEIATSIDVITLHNRGWSVTILPDEKTTVFPEWKCIAKEYVQLNIAAKEKADREKNQTMRSIAKLLSNALYGSFATKLDNKKTVFSDHLEEDTVRDIAAGVYSVKSSSYIETENLCAEIMPEFVVAYPPPRHADTSAARDSNDSDSEGDPFIPVTPVTSYQYKPITFVDAEDQDFCLHTLEKNSPLVSNNRYASQIASFVLAWTRAFVSEWAQFLYAEDAGTPLERRALKSVYGDTDSLFLTARGYRLMEEKGKKRIKKHGGPLVFDPENPDLTWLVECETQCSRCGADAYSSESVFLAPKLYALKDTTCPACGFVGKGKLRAKGHAAAQLSYELLTLCYYADAQQGSDKFHTSRMSLRRALASVQAHVQPFTVTETTLTRTLRPWKDKTLHELDEHRLVPYCRRWPNPRNTEITWMDLSWMNSDSSGPDSQP
ncbi:DNA polymerase [Equine adenovirus 1]|uniref:DNA polymerase n=1 Tax=Equine adenovirus A serotype 1 TaxID=46916 RepID=A0A1B0XB99_ADEE1|nr:DNA polymerase [Equine adenovirus 1]